MDKKAYYIGAGGTQTEVTKEVYLAYYRSKRRDRYFERDIKTGKPIRDKDGNVTGYTAAKEDSYERVFGTEENHSGDQESVEDTVIRRITLDTLRNVLDKLPEEERDLIDALFFSNDGEGMSEREYAALSGIPHQTVHSRKLKILAALKKLLGK